MIKDNPSVENLPEIFISYAWGEEGEERENIVDELQKVFEENQLKIIRDKVDGVKYRGSIQEFMKRIGRGNMKKMLKQNLWDKRKK